MVVIPTDIRRWGTFGLTQFWQTWAASLHHRLNQVVMASPKCGFCYKHIYRNTSIGVSCVQSSICTVTNMSYLRGGSGGAVGRLVPVQVRGPHLCSRKCAELKHVRRPIIVRTRFGNVLAKRHRQASPWKTHRMRDISANICVAAH